VEGRKGTAKAWRRNGEKRARGKKWQKDSRLTDVGPARASSQQLETYAHAN
jgi:hypothetical protein